MPPYAYIITKLLHNAVQQCIIADSGVRPHFRKRWFSQRATCLEQYVENDEGRQMRLLCALQLAVEKLNPKHPPGQYKCSLHF